MKPVTMSLGTDASGSYIQHELTQGQRMFRQLVGVVATLAIIAVLFVLCGVSSALIVWLMVAGLVGSTSVVPDWLDMGAVMVWATLTLALMVAVLFRGLGAMCYMFVDWAKGRERVVMFQDD